MKQKNYMDGTPSREVEDIDDESDLEVDNAYRRSVLCARDRLGNLKRLVTVCREALIESQLYEIKSIVTDVLYFFVEEEINKVDEELSGLCNQ